MTGTIDLGITHQVTDQPELASELFTETPIALALAREHRLARRARISLRSLRGEQLVLMRPELAGEVYDPFLAACRAAGLNLPVFQYTNDFTTKMWLVSAGFGVSPTMLPGVQLPNVDVVYRPLAARLPCAKVFLVYRKTNESPLVKKFIAHVKRARAELGSPSV